MTNKNVKEKLITIYGNRCMLTNININKDKHYLLAMHHITKRCEGGQKNIDNGSNLIASIHDWLHNTIERDDRELFDLISECLYLYKKCMDENNLELIKQWREECVPLFIEANENSMKNKVKTKSKRRK